MHNFPNSGTPKKTTVSRKVDFLGRGKGSNKPKDGATLEEGEFDLYRTRTIDIKQELGDEIPIYKVGRQPALGSTYPSYYRIGSFDRRVPRDISDIEYEIKLALFKSEAKEGRFQVRFRYWQDFGARRRTVLVWPRDKVLRELLPMLESVTIEQLRGDVLPEACWFEDGSHLQSGRTMRTDVMTTKGLEPVEILRELSEIGNLIFVGWIFTRDPAKWPTELVMCGEREGLSGTYYLRDLDERYPMWVLSPKAAKGTTSNIC